MIEYEEIDGKLQLVTDPCKHGWSEWYETFLEHGSIRTCSICKSKQVLTPQTF